MTNKTALFDKKRKAYIGALKRELEKKGISENFGDTASNLFIDYLNKHDASWNERARQLTAFDNELENLIDGI